MAKFYYDAAGNFLAFSRNDAQDGRIVPPAGQHASSPLAFDETSNAAVCDAIGLAPLQYTVVAGVLKRNGVTVAVAADDPATADKKALLANAAQAVSDNNTYLAIGSPTNAQVAAQVRTLTQQNNRIIKRLAQFTT
jgi:hypothetical protein